MGSVVNIKQLSRFKMTESSLFSLSFAALCCVRRWQGSPSYFLSARAPPPPPCRLRPCHVTSITVTTCTGRKRRTISLDGMEPEGAVQPSTFKREVEGESVKQDEASSKVNRNREGRFLLYWITTTSISTSTSFTITYSVSSALCTPASANECG